MTGEYKRLYRSRKERTVAGVCGGIGEYFGIDPTLIRILFVVGLMMGGPGVLAYLILMIVVPEEPLPMVSESPGTADKENATGFSDVG
jgi:phage shock protein C